MNFNNYLFRASQVGQIISVPKTLTASQIETLNAYRERMTGNGKPLTPKQTEDWHSLENKLNESKNYKLTATAEKYLIEKVFEAKYKRSYNTETKYFSKGLEKEKESRELLSEILGTFLTIDEERKSNEWVTGKRDINSNLIIDIKTAWDFQSYMRHLVDSTNEIYLRQLDSYMDLWGIKESLLCHILVDTPFNLIEDEIKRLDWKYNIMDIDGNIRDEHIVDVVDEVSKYIYTRKSLEEFCNQSTSIHIDWFDDFIEMPKEERIHMIPHQFDKARIEQRNECIKIAREYMNGVKPLNNIIKILT